MSAHLLDQILYPEDRTALFIDGANLYSAARGLQFDIDYKKLLAEVRKRTRLIRATYYTALIEDQDFSPIRPLVDWLDYNGYALSTKAAKEYQDSAGRRRIKGDMDVEIAVDMMELSANLDHAVLFSGDGDFVALLRAVQRRGVRVSVVSTTRSNPPMVADDLRRQADHFIELTDLSSLIGRPPRTQERARQDDDRHDHDGDDR